VNVVLADQPRLIGLGDRELKVLALENIFAANIDEAIVRAHGATGDKAAFDQAVGVEAEDLPVLAGARLRFVGIDDQIVGPLALLLGHEGPLQAGGEAGPAAPAQAGRLDLIA
jgi:hypothetical protein